MPRHVWRRRVAWLCEALLVGVVLATFARVVILFRLHGYLPPPFLYNPTDTLMDWFNVAFWAHQQGAYDVWKAVYPPLSFVFLKVFSLPDCYLYDPFYGRDCDWVGRTALLAIYAIDVVLVAKVFYRTDRSTAALRTIAFAFGFAMLYALERGNLILLCLTFFIIAYGDLVRARWLRWLSAALTINFKPYLLLPLLSLPIKRDWRGFEVTGFLTLFVYLVTWAMFGQGDPFLIMQNLGEWTINYNDQAWQPIFYTTTYAPMLNVQTFHLPVLKFLSSRMVDNVLRDIPILIDTSQMLTLLCVLGAWLHPTALPKHRLAAILLAVGLVSQSWGGYTQILLLFLVYLEPWRRPGQVVALVSAYILNFSAEIMITLFPIGDEPWQRTGWLAGRTIEHQFGLGWGQFVRPGLIALILWGLALDSLHLIIMAHRREPVWPWPRRRTAVIEAPAAP